MNLQKPLLFIALLLNGLYAGSAMYSLMGVGPAMRLMQPSVYVEFHQKLDYFMGIRMALFAKATLLINVLLLIITIRRAARPVIVITTLAFLLFIAELCYTLMVHVPLNEKIQLWNIHTLPVEWMEVRAKWIWFDTIRALFAMAAFIVYLTAGRYVWQKQAE